MNKNTLSKSTFIRGLQCHKSLYLYKNRYFLRDKLSPEQLAKFKRGTNVGVLARDLFPGGFDASPPTHFQTGRALETTRELVAKKHPVIYEAYFSYNSVIVALDILEHRDGKWYANEVKSSLAISETYLNDAALQYHVISNCGIELEDFSIIYMNKDYVLQGELDLNQLFVAQSVLEEARSRQPMIFEEIEAQLKVADLPKSPTIDIGPHCNKPYPCDFQGHCWKYIPKNSIFDLQWLSEEQKFELYSKKTLQLEDIPDDFLSDPVQRMKLQAHKTATPFIDKEFIRSFIEKIEHPLCFLKAWYYRPAVPLYEGTGPYERLPFYLSTGVKQHKDAPLEFTHHYFEPEANPLPAISIRVKEILDQYNSIITFSDHHILNVIIQDVRDYLKVFNLAEVLEGNHFYDPLTNGSNDLLTIGSQIFNKNIVDTGIYESETLAVTAFIESLVEKTSQEKFVKKMEVTSRLHLDIIAGFIDHIHEPIK